MPSIAPIRNVIRIIVAVDVMPGGKSTIREIDVKVHAKGRTNGGPLLFLVLSCSALKDHRLGILFFSSVRTSASLTISLWLLCAT